MVECFGFSLVDLKLRRTRNYFRSQGLQYKPIDVENASTLYCWVSSNGSVEKSEIAPKPALLLIHGFGADGLVAWETQIAPLIKQFSLYIPDLLFFGESTTKNSQRSEFYQAECIRKMMQILGVQQAIAVGHSYGGFVAFRLAHMYPEFVTRLIVVSSGICMNPHTNDPLLKKFGATHIKEVLLPDTVEGLRKCMNLVFYKLPWLPDFLFRDMMLTLGGNRERRMELIDGIILGTEQAPPLPKLSQEVLIIWGDRDEIFNIELAHQLQRHLTEEKAKLVIIREVGHVPTIQRPKEVNKAILSFLGSP